MKRKVLFLIIFTVIGLIAFQISIDRIVGSNQNFTLFELLGPVGGMFLGPVLGAVSAFVVRMLNVVMFHQKLDFLTIIRFLPAMLAAVYFGLKQKKTAIIFPICIALFLLNPIGRQAWMYSLIWLIPFAATFAKKRLIFNSLGATFTAHAVGSVIFLYSFGLTPAIWISLIPIVFIERGLFTIGIWASCLAFNFVLDKLTNFKFASALKPFVKPELLFNAGKSN
ncbi:MAG: hypothetical protein NT155_01925 [Candidatus Staskawiczbacteria bacterium]|nr:hypothetical protein [Candidatus Staskawiczbacteria bacterium]